MKISKNTLKLAAAVAGSATITLTAAASDLRKTSDGEKYFCKFEHKQFLKNVKLLAEKDVKTVKVDDKTYTLSSVNWDKLTAKQRAELQKAVDKAKAGDTKAEPKTATTPIKVDGKTEWYCGPCGRG
jgi:uncharacterized protein YbcV (DUF1398 family)